MIEHKELPRALGVVADALVNIERLNDVFVSTVLIVKDKFSKVSVLVFDGEKFSALVNRGERLKFQNISTEPKEILHHFDLAVKKLPEGGYTVTSATEKVSDTMYAFDAATLMNLYMDENSAVTAAIDFLDNNKYF